MLTYNPKSSSTVEVYCEIPLVQCPKSKKKKKSPNKPRVHDQKSMWSCPLVDKSKTSASMATLLLQRERKQTKVRAKGQFFYVNPTVA